MVPEATLEQTEHGLVANGEGWFVANARDSRWYYVEGRGAFCDFEGEQEFEQLGINLQALMPGRRDGDVPLGGRPGGLPRRVGRGRC